MSTLSGLRRFTLLLEVISLMFLYPRGDAQTESITLGVDPASVSSGGTLCPNTSIYFNCTALNVEFLIWERNDQQIQDYTPLDNAPLNQIIGEYILFLNTSTPAQAVGERRNLTSTLVGTLGSGFQTGDRIECVDNTGQLITLDFTQISAPPAPTGFRNTIISQRSLLYFGFIWDTAFNTANNVGTYRLVADDASVSCKENCSSSSDSCQCSGLSAGVNVNISISAVSCGSLEGPIIVVNVTPQVPEETITCSGYGVYSYSGNLTMIQVIWDKAQDPPEIAPGLSQNVVNYSVSINGDRTDVSTLHACLSTSTECLFSYPIQTSSILADTNFSVSVIAYNVVGGGPASLCPLPSMNMSQIFSLTLATTDPNNRMVVCTQLYQGNGTFRCEICLNSSSSNCYDLEDNSQANAALNSLEDGSYSYRVTVYIDGVPIASISDNFSTSCQLDELGVINADQPNLPCDFNGGSIYNGAVCYNGTVAGSFATYRCKEGYMLTRTEQRICGSDGRWSGETPLCAIIDIGSPYTESLRISLLVVTAFLYILSAVLSGITLALVLIDTIKPCSWLGFMENITKWCVFFVEMLLLLLSFVLWVTYFGNQNGLSHGNALIASFAFSVLLFLLSTAWMIIIVVKFVRKKQKKNLDKPDKHRGKKSGVLAMDQ